MRCPAIFAAFFCLAFWLPIHTCKLSHRVGRVAAVNKGVVQAVSVEVPVKVAPVVDRDREVKLVNSLRLGLDFLTPMRMAKSPPRKSKMQPLRYSNLIAIAMAV
jgi:hypothetical protein